MLILAVGLAAGLVIGIAAHQGGICAVTASKEVLFERRFALFTGFALAAAVAGALVLPLAWIGGGAARLSPGFGIGASLVAGAVLVGVGAALNGACLFGTLYRIGDGQIRFLAVLPGLAVGFAAGTALPAPAPTAAGANPLAAPSPMAMAALLGFVAAALGAAVLVGRLQAPARPGWPIRRAMIVLGLSGSLLYALEPGWTYADVVRRGVAPVEAERMWAGWPDGTLVALATLSGAALSGLRSRRFALQRPRAAAILRSLAGGAVMAFGATLVPGGNDTLLLWSVPSLTASGLVAYVVMTASVLAALGISARRRA